MLRATQRGLTLIELLAALVILSAVAATGASILSGAARTAMSAGDLAAATEILDRHDHGVRAGMLNPEITWRHEAPGGRSWVVRTFMPAPRDTAPAATDQDRSCDLLTLWSVTTVALDGTRSIAGERVVLRRRSLIDLADQEPDAEGAAP